MLYAFKITTMDETKALKDALAEYIKWFGKRETKTDKLPVLPINKTIMSKMKELDTIAEGIADVTMELMKDSIDWQLEDFPQDGDEYNAIHAAVMTKAIEYMYLLILPLLKQKNDGESII